MKLSISSSALGIRATGCAGGVPRPPGAGGSPSFWGRPAWPARPARDRRGRSDGGAEGRRHLHGGRRHRIVVDRHVEVVDDDPLGVGRPLLQRDEGADVLEQLAERDRLVDVILGPGAQLAVLLEGLLGGLARHDDERHVLEVRVLLQLVAHREAVHPRQLDGEKDEVRPVGGGDLQADVAVVDHLHGGAQAPQLAAKLAGERWIGFENQDFGHCSRARSPARCAEGRSEASGEGASRISGG